MPREPSFEKVLQNIVRGTSSEVGEDFFSALVVNLSEALNVPAAWVSEYTAGYDQMHSLAFLLDGELITDVIFPVAGTPCEVVMKGGELVYFAEKVAGNFPDDPDLVSMGMVSYAGVPFLDPSGKALGHVAVMDRCSMLNKDFILGVLKIFASRAGAELIRIRAEREVKQRERKLAHLLESAPDSIVELGPDLQVLMLNDEACKLLGVTSADCLGRPFADFFARTELCGVNRLISKIKESCNSQQKTWLPGHLAISRPDKSEIPVELTVSHFLENDQSRFILIIRNINERLAAEEELRSLRLETQLLKEELSDILKSGNIIGTSSAILKVLNDVKQVARTNATVLINGQTGSGKELFARLIHDTSKRSDKPLVKVNCAAIPSGLIESELFGHVKGAFTGALEKRVGRFALADGGTIFLDEIGELPIDLQPKLLRVLQEGEFEPVGSSKTITVNVRIIAATNRDLKEMIEQQTFREDLYYRLSVFPIDLPSLCERGDDIVLLAETFIEKYSKEMGKSVLPYLTNEQKHRLKSYSWPGNIRELQNVIERAVITTQDSLIDLERSLPDQQDKTVLNTAAPTLADQPSQILNAEQMKSLEKINIERALKQTGGRVSGEEGAAQLLGLPTSTLNSRIKALGIK